MAVAMLGHMQRFYDLLDSLATDTDGEGRIYEGKITEDFNKLDLPTPYYSKMTKQMQQMGCMTQLQRGGRNLNSKWLLHAPPTEDAYAEVDPNETNLNVLQEQIRVYQSSQDQKIRVLRKELDSARSAINHLNNAVSQQATLIAHLHEKLNLPLEDINQGAD